MTPKQEQQLKFLHNTIKYYKTHPRGLTPKGTCSYVHGCAIGRHLDVRLASTLDSQTCSSVEEKEIFERLPKKLQNLGQKFLERIQTLHDCSTYWVENTMGGHDLSWYGDAKMEEIKKWVMDGTLDTNA